MAVDSTFASFFNTIRAAHSSFSFEQIGHIVAKLHTDTHRMLQQEEGTRMGKLGKEFAPTRAVGQENRLHCLYLAHNVTARINGIHTGSKPPVIALAPRLQRLVRQAVRQYVATESIERVVT